MDGMPTELVMLILNFILIGWMAEHEMKRNMAVGIFELLVLQQTFGNHGQA